MTNKIVETLINKQSQNEIITNEDEQIYRYGYILLCEVVLNLVIALIIGIVFLKTKEIMFFLCVYIPLRSFCGGWHANKIWKCTIISNAILLLQVYCIENIVNLISSERMLIICFFNMICVFFLAPIETEKKKISHEERLIYRKKIKVMLVLHLITILATILWDNKQLEFSIMFAYITQSVMLLLEIAKISLSKRVIFRKNQEYSFEE
ncbi:accessory gene regulator B family protein [Acetivibrio ethanolgignens]|uniref:Accessory regulator AgrB n=1 Tax=Acetivibrio ethanolgignens TaxID=290052 RepID=A0A0V8QHW0_9FIRM|nr:accessory gene regulator B family protein [Acetivibrio ethanolgignens]KSV60062.1 hypothetical protein ASU35_17495 [Acetivibrio ethanolgignens]